MNTTSAVCVRLSETTSLPWHFFRVPSRYNCTAETDFPYILDIIPRFRRSQTAVPVRLKPNPPTLHFFRGPESR
jgi:hypothetical protein